MRCVKKADFAEAVRQQCSEAKRKAGEYDTCRANLDRVRGERDEAHGALKLRNDDWRAALDDLNAQKARNALLVEQLAKADRRWKWYTWLAIGLGAGAATTAGAVVLLRL